MVKEKTALVSFMHDGPERDNEFDIRTCEFLKRCGATSSNSHVYLETIDRVKDGATIATVVYAEIPWSVYRKIVRSGLRPGFIHDGIRYMEGKAIV